MKAIRVTEHGGPEVLRLREVDTPPVGPGQARVRLDAAGVNFVDVNQRRGGFGTADLAARAAGADEVILYTRQDFVAEVKRLTGGRGADLIIDGVGKTTFPGDLEAAALRGHVVVFGAASGPADPISPNALMPRSLTVS